MLQVFSPPRPTFEHVRHIWMDGKQSIHLEFQYPAARHAIHVRFQGSGKPQHALLFAQELPEQVELSPLLQLASLMGQPWMPEVQGYRSGLREEEGFRFENLGAGAYTLVVMLPGGFFRTPLTVGAEEQTFPVDIPSKLTPRPPMRKK